MAKTRKKSEVPTAAPRFEASEPQRNASPRPDEMSPDVLEFITAIDEYKRANRRPFPSWSEVLEILKTLGYSRTR